MPFGAHISAAGGLYHVFARAEAVGCEVLQLFSKSERQWRAKPLTDDIVASFRAERARSHVQPLLVHDSYLINLASPRDDLWSTSTFAFKEELERCATLEIPYLVTHPGAHTGSGVQAGLEREAEALNGLFAEGVGGEVMVLLETTAGQGTCLGGNFEELAQLFELIRYPARIGVCVDTCHLFAAGYDLRTADSYASVWEQFEQVIGMQHIKAVHVNDSQGELGGHLDRHAAVGEGKIGLEGFRLLVNDPRFKDVPMVLETPKSDDGDEDRRNLATLRGLRAETAVR